MNRAARASRPCATDPSQEKIMPLVGAERKTGSLCSSHLHKGPALSYLAAIPNGCKGCFKSFREVSLCVRGAPRRRNLSVADTTTSFSLKSSLRPSWWLPSIKTTPLPADGRKVHLTDDDLQDMVLDHRQAKKLFEQHSDLFLDIAQREDITRELIAIGYRRCLG